jgi:hypothetical protein
VARTAHSARPFLVGLLGLSILLFALASLPRVAVPDRRLSDLLVRHRLDLVTVGATALVAVAVSYLLG